jgi:hypothetical protein
VVVTGALQLLDCTQDQFSSGPIQSSSRSTIVSWLLTGVRPMSCILHGPELTGYGLCNEVQKRSPLAGCCFLSPPNRPRATDRHLVGEGRYLGNLAR